MEKIEESTRRQVAAWLPGALEKTLESYHAFVGQNVLITSKEFLEHHKAGQVAVAHINLLLKLAQWADIEPEMHKNEAFIEAFILAGEGFAKHKSVHPDPEDESHFQPG